MTSRMNVRAFRAAVTMLTAGVSTRFSVARTSGVIESVGFIDHDATATEIEVNGHVDQRGKLRAKGLPAVAGHEEQHETAAAGAEKLAAIGAGGDARIVDLVD